MLPASSLAAPQPPAVRDDPTLTSASSWPPACPQHNSSAPLATQHRRPLLQLAAFPSPATCIGRPTPIGGAGEKTLPSTTVPVVTCSATLRSSPTAEDVEVLGGGVGSGGGGRVERLGARAGLRVMHVGAVWRRRGLSPASEVVAVAADLGHG